MHNKNKKTWVKLSQTSHGKGKLAIQKILAKPEYRNAYELNQNKICMRDKNKAMSKAESNIS